MEETHELLLCAPESSSIFCRFFALISFMASSMERVSLLLATGTGREDIISKYRGEMWCNLSETKQLSDTHHSHKPCWPLVCVRHLLQLRCRSGDCTCLCSWSWDMFLPSLSDWMLFLPMQPVPAEEKVRDCDGNSRINL